MHFLVDALFAQANKFALIIMHSFYYHLILKKRFKSIGIAPQILRPWNVQVGSNVSLGNHVHMMASKSDYINLNTWPRGENQAEVLIGDYVIISPGVRISAGSKIKIGNSVLIAHGVYVTDSNWHDLYDRTKMDSMEDPVIIEDNVWLCDRCTILKGVTIGKNSIVAAGAVVTKSFPANVVIAGNPAKIVKQFDSERVFTTRRQIFDPK